ncbi:EF-P lysine aminoacylase EpmA [Flaviflagellibacter deserti]|uniref:EF-P lysine aminoacylase EpmA n=1 Tax=Flaviflagellibacter deserti TaxID=2267266 RepID=A0ABV9YXP7_9HYPH
MTDASPWWDKGRHADRRPFLKERGRIKARLRAEFAADGFTEIEAGVLQTSPGNEAHLHGFATEIVDPGVFPFPSGERARPRSGPGEGQPGIDDVFSSPRPSPRWGEGEGRRPLYLHTSPEFAAKKLLAAGEEKIFDFARVFRNRERGALHHPEFTMLEWYRTGEPYEALFEDCAKIVRLAAETTGLSTFLFRDRVADALAEPERVTVADAFRHFAGIDLFTSIEASGATDRDHLAGSARAAGIRVADDDVWADIFSRVLVEKVEPHLGIGRPTILCEYPVAEAALARPLKFDPRVAERFELYICGVELANGFGELTDAGEQRRRFEVEMAEKERVYGEHYPIDEDFLAALFHMPEACGCALGFDRLVMLATGASRIEQVIWTPVP